MKTHIGIAGEFRCVVKRKDGSIKTDTGYQKNLILDQGLDFFGGGYGDDMMSYGFVGSRNSLPTADQTNLDNLIAYVSGSNYGYKNSYDSEKDGDYYRIHRGRKFLFENMGDVNISEIGIGSRSDYLCTRALIKDGNGNPTSITILSDEILELYYYLWEVFDVRDKTYVIKVIKDGIATDYNTIVRLAKVTDYDYIYNDGNHSIGAPLRANYLRGMNNYFYRGELGSIYGKPTNSIDRMYTSGYGKYEPRSFKKVMYINLNINDINDSIRSVYVDSTLGMWQIRYGSVDDDSPIIKTNRQKMKISFEFSWGRYEGEL